MTFSQIRPGLVPMLAAGICCLGVSGRTYSEDRGTDTYQRASRLLEESRTEPDGDRRVDLMIRAEDAFRAFLKESPQDPVALAARTQLGNLLVERARLQLEQTPGTTGQSKANRLYEQARLVFDQVRLETRQKLLDMPPRNDRQSEKEALKRRDALRAQYLQAQLLMAAVLEESADTCNFGDARWNKSLTAAADEYRAIYEKYGTRMAGLYARMYESRCLIRLGKSKTGIQCLTELLEQPDEPPVLFALKTRALAMALPVWLNGSQRGCQDAVAYGDAWLEKATGQDRDSPNGLAIQFHLADAHHGLADTLVDARQVVAHREKADGLNRYVADRDGPYQAKAKRLLGEVDGAAIQRPNSGPATEIVRATATSPQHAEPPAVETAAAAPAPDPQPPRRWTLYFPQDWRHPAIRYPPVKVFLDPPYGIEDPFGRIPSPPPPAASSKPSQPAPTPPPIPSPGPRVLELNPETGKLEERK